MRFLCIHETECLSLFKKMFKIFCHLTVYLLLWCGWPCGRSLSVEKDAKVYYKCKIYAFHYISPRCTVDRIRVFAGPTLTPGALCLTILSVVVERQAIFSPSPWLKESLTISKSCAEYMKFCGNVKKKKDSYIKQKTDLDLRRLTWHELLYRYMSIDRCLV